MNGIRSLNMSGPKKITSKISSVIKYKPSPTIRRVNLSLARLEIECTFSNYILSTH